jgi:ribosomal-protein-alanine N-acetyltransferase
MPYQNLTISTPRLTIRLMRAADLADSIEHRSDPQVCRFVGEPLTQQQAEQKLQLSMAPWLGQENQKLMLAIELTSQKKLIGELMFKYTLLDSEVGEIGYRLNRHYQGKGYAFEATSAFISLIFDNLSVQKINAVCVTTNQASWQLMEKLGMDKEGTLRSHFKIGDKRFDAFIYSLLAK